MIFDELPIAFPWYDNQQKQNRFKENVENLTPYGLISPKNSLLPFQFKRTPIVTPPTEWLITNIDTGAILDISGQIAAQLRQGNIPGRATSYFYYDGAAITGVNLAKGYYQSSLSWGLDDTYYSEVFQIPDCAFNVGAVNEFLQLVWYNNTDIDPIFYNDLAGDGTPYFKNVIYLDSFIHASDPEVVEDHETDGADNDIPTFQKAIRRYHIADMMPDFLKLALVVMQMHDHVFLTTRKGLRTGELSEISVTPALEQNGAFSTVEIAFEESIMIKKGCGDNMA
jgi:hypothetical protein